MDPVARRQSVCRSLFGPVDHEQLRRELKLKLKEMIEQDSRRWNFNFQTDTPLPGRFQWEETAARGAAAPYLERAPLKLSSPPLAEEDHRLREEERGAGTDQENCSSISNTRTRTCPAEATPVRRKRSKPAAKPRRYARITDFFTKRRRTTETKSANHFQSEAAPKTIR